MQIFVQISVFPDTELLHYVGPLRPAFVAHAANRLDTLICAQTGAMLKEAGVVTPPHAVSAMLYLHRCGPATVADIAAADGQSHQLVSWRVEPLIRLKLVAKASDKADKRRKVLTLTAKGASDAAAVEAVCADIAAALADMQREIGVDLMAALERAEKSLAMRPITERAGARGRQPKRALR